MLPPTNTDRAARDFPIALPPHHRGHEVWLRVGTTALTLAMLSGVVLWQVQQRPPARLPETAPPRIGRAAAARVPGPVAMRRPAPAAPVAAPRAAVPTRVFLVSTPEQAQHQQELLEAADDLTINHTATVILVIAATAAGEALLQSLDDADATLAGLGRPGIVLVDLRAP